MASFVFFLFHILQALLRLFDLFASKRVHNLSEHKLHGEEGAENDQKAEEKYGNGI